MTTDISRKLMLPQLVLWRPRASLACLMGLVVVLSGISPADAKRAPGKTDVAGTRIALGPFKSGSKEKEKPPEAKPASANPAIKAPAKPQDAKPADAKRADAKQEKAVTVTKTEPKTAEKDTSSKPNAKPAESTSEKPKKGLFGLGKGGKSKKGGEAQAEPAKETKGEADKEPAPEKTEAETPAEGQAKEGATTPPAPAKASEKALEEVRPLVPDAALISVLRDLSKSLKDSEEAAKIEDECQKKAFSVAALALAKAVGSADLQGDRILTEVEKAKLQAAMRTEAWASGDIVLSKDCHASLSAVWAKKVDGLVNVAIAGNCGCKQSPAGDKVGEFVFVLNGKSAVDTGFDIQSQTDVNFWIGKLTSLAVDTTCCSEGEATDSAVKDKAQGAALVLQTVLTERSRQHQAQVSHVSEHNRNLAAAVERERLQAEEKSKAEAEAQAKAKAEADAKFRVEAEARAEAEIRARAKEEKKPVPAQVAAAPEAAAAAARAVVEDPRTGATKPIAQADPAYAQSRTAPYGSAYPDVAMASPMPEPVRAQSPQSSGGWDSPAPPPTAKAPSAAAKMVLPDKAIAGQFLTAAVINQKHAPETEIELSFNGATLATGQDGKALFLVPEDAIPGPTLQVAMVSRPDVAPSAIYVQQPIAQPQGPQVPRVDAVSLIVPARGTIVIDGHSFDGVSNRNSVVVDGMWDARALVASPVQIKADLPANLTAGPHSVSVSTGGLRSNPGQFEVVEIEVQPLVKESQKDVLKKMVVRVNGTKSAIRVKVKNFTPDVVRLGKTTELHIITPGGANNAVTLDAQRLKPGAYHIEAAME